MIVDANILLSAALGRSLPRLLAWRRGGLALQVPEHQLREVRLLLVHRFARSADEVERQLGDLARAADPIPVALYADQEPRARRRLGSGGQKDWPVLAAALALDEAVLSDDRDFFGTGVVVWTPRVLARELEDIDG